MAQKIRNPFLHTHEHDHGHHGHDHNGHEHEHDHDHGPGSDVHLPVADELDPAQRAVADALRICFVLLQVVMLVLVVLYAVSNVYTVAEQQVAVRLRFGKIVGEGAEQQVIPPGGPHFAFPYPIEQVVYLPTSLQTITLDRAFWREVKAGEEGKTIDELPEGPLNPEKDGSLLTGDANIFHVRWTVTYQIKRPIDFMRAVAEPTGDPAAILAAAEAFVRAAAEQGAVHAMAAAAVDDLARGQFPGAAEAVAAINKALADMKTGLEVQTLAMRQPTPPRSVKAAFDASINAENEKARLIAEAEKDRRNTLIQAAGGAAMPQPDGGDGPLVELISAYQSAYTRNDAEALRRLDAELDRYLLPDASGDLMVGGVAAQRIREAEAFKETVKAQMAAEAKVFESELAQYRKFPELVKASKWYEAMQAVLTGDVETIYLPEGRPYLQLNRDPAVKAAIEAEALKQQSPGN